MMYSEIIIKFHYSYYHSSSKHFFTSHMNMYYVLHPVDIIWTNHIFLWYHRYPYENVEIDNVSSKNIANEF